MQSSTSVTPVATGTPCRTPEQAQQLRTLVKQCEEGRCFENTLTATEISVMRELLTDDSNVLLLDRGGVSKIAPKNLCVRLGKPVGSTYVRSAVASLVQKGFISRKLPSGVSVGYVVTLPAWWRVPIEVEPEIPAQPTLPWTARESGGSDHPPGHPPAHPPEKLAGGPVASAVALAGFQAEIGDSEQKAGGPRARAGLLVGSLKTTTTPTAEESAEALCHDCIVRGVAPSKARRWIKECDHALIRRAIRITDANDPKIVRVAAKLIEAAVTRPDDFGERTISSPSTAALTPRDRLANAIAEQRKVEELRRIEATKIAAADALIEQQFAALAPEALAQRLDALERSNDPTIVTAGWRGRRGKDVLQSPAVKAAVVRWQPN